MKDILSQRKVKIALSILVILIGVLVGMHVMDGTGKKEYHHLLEKTAAFAKEQSGDVSYVTKEANGVTAIAYVPHEENGQPSTYMAQIMQEKLDDIVKTANKRNTVYVIYAKKSEPFSEIKSYDLYQEEYHYQNKTYEKITSQQFRTLLKEKEWLTFGKLFGSETTDIAKIIEPIKEAVSQEHLSAEARKEILTQVTAENIPNLPYVYTNDHFGLVFNVQGAKKVVLLKPNNIVMYFKPTLLFDTYKEQLATQLAQVQKIRAEQAKEKNGEILSKIAHSAPTKKVALTFDDGPHRARTTRVLDILKEENVKATFFILGQNVKGNEDVLQRTVKEGHQLGNHSWSHPDLRTLSPEAIKSEIEKTQQVIQQATGVVPTILRPPYGAINDKVNQSINLAVLMWSVDSNDWRLRNAPAITQRVIAQTSGGSIILMHDIHEESVNAVRGIIKGLKEKGYEFVTVDELYGKENIIPNVQYFSSNNARNVN